MSNIFEGIDVPAIKYQDATTAELPKCNGESKDGLQDYRFIKQTRDSYLSESNKRIEIGNTWLFEVELSWLTMSKADMVKLRKAENDASVELTLNKDKPEIKFDMRVQQLEVRFVKGFRNHPAGYSVKVVFQSVEQYSQSGYEALVGEGYGSNYGEDYGNS